MATFINNNDHSMNPRISFSNDFADHTQQQATGKSYREAPVSSDFEFSVRNYNMMIPADEIFFKGSLLPLKKDSQQRKLTLREELLVGSGGDDFVNDDALPRLTKSSGWWKEKLGLKKCHQVMSKKSDGFLEEIVEEKSSVFVHEEGHVVAKTIQELLLEGGLNCRETGI